MIQGSTKNKHTFWNAKKITFLAKAHGVKCSKIDVLGQNTRFEIQKNEDSGQNTRFEMFKKMASQGGREVVPHPTIICLKVCLEKIGLDFLVHFGIQNTFCKSETI